MGIFDRFKKDATSAGVQPAEMNIGGARSSAIQPDARTRAITDPSAPAGPDELRPAMLLEVQLDPADIAVPFRDSEVMAANRVAAHGIVAGHHRELPAPVAEWIQNHADQAVSPTHFGYTWYPRHEAGIMQLVDTRLLEADPNQRVGSLLWGSRAAIDKWTVSPIELSPQAEGRGGFLWVAPDGFHDIKVATDDEGTTYGLDLFISRELGSPSLAREFLTMLHTAVQFIDGFEPEGISQAVPDYWGITGIAGAEEALLRAAVVSLYAIGDRLPPALNAVMPVSDLSGGIPASLNPALIVDVSQAVDSTSEVAPVSAEPVAAEATAGPGTPEHEFSDYQKLIDEGHELPLDDPRFQRKLRSEQRLQARGVPTLAWMSMIEGEDEAVIRAESEVVDRAICLMAMAVKAEVVRDGEWPGFAPHIDAILDDYSVRQNLTAKERDFLADPAPDPQTNTQFGWGYEAFWTLLWALGFVDELSWPTQICDVPFACGVVRDRGPDGFRSEATLRSSAEIIEEADHIYRLHWAVRNAQVNGTFPAPAVDPGIVMGRHKTLNWLMTYQDQEWDVVSTDT